MNVQDLISLILFIINKKRYIFTHNCYRGFSKEFDPCIEEIVSATLEVYKQCRLNLLPTPSKSHYTFNLRDFSKVILVRATLDLILMFSTYCFILFDL